MSKKSKTPSRSSPKPKTPEMLSISELATSAIDTALNTADKFREGLPLGKIGTLGIKAEQVEAMIKYPDIIRGFLVMLILIALTVCVTLFYLGHTDSKNVIIEEYGNEIPSYIFSAWFVVPSFLSL